MAKKKARRGARSDVAKASRWRDRPIAIVTGASSGIGREFALLLAHQGFDLVCVGRDAERLSSLARGIEEIHGRLTLVLPVDLGQKEGARTVYDECQRRAIVPEVLINNAGVGMYGPFVERPLDEHERMIYVNVMSALTLTRLFLPLMIERRRGNVLIVASTSGFQPGPLMANYYATKSYLISLGVALARETKGSGVSVSVLCPGPTRTEFHRRSGVRHVPVASLAFLPARKVAEVALSSMRRHKTLIIPGLINKIGSTGVRLLPPAVAAEIVKRFHQ